MGYKIPKMELVKATLSWVAVGIPYALGWVATFIMGLFVAATSERQYFHPQGKRTSGQHSDKYVVEGASGKWEYWGSPYKILRWWNNYEDGTLGEPSGKHSARCSGNERSFWNQYLWTIRNPFNYGKRSLPLFHCKINNCSMEYWGDLEVSDKEVGQGGWHFCKATDKLTGRVYYWYRSVRNLGNNKVRVAAIGFKVKPIHALVIQDADDEDKAFTIRLPVKTNID